MGAWNGGEAKRCTCCGKVHDEAGWRSLRLVGYMPLTDETDCEIRDCDACASSIAVEVPSAAFADTQPAPAMAVAS